MKNSKTWLAPFGAAGGVTGSKTILRHESGTVLVDCGLFQGTTLERQQNWQPFPFDQTALQAVIVTHAHMDHAGSLPLLVQRGYTGPIYCTQGTAELLPILLYDSARLQAEEANYRNKRGWSKHHPALPLYTENDVDRTLDLLEPCPYEIEQRANGLTFSFHPAEHIIGSAHVLVRPESGERILFSGDIGRGNHPLFGSQPVRPLADFVLCESTYGNRLHGKIDPDKELLAALRPVLARGGTVLLPAFAVGRAQELLVSLETIFASGALPRCPVYLDSPMSASVLQITESGQSEITPEGRAALEQAHQHTKIIAEAAQSKELNEKHGPAVIVCSSGMLTGGRVLHHLIARASHTKDAIVLCGFQARGTRGRKLADGETTLKIFGQEIELKLEVLSLNSFSAHADQEGLLKWLDSAPLPKKILINHGEPVAASGLCTAIRSLHPELDVNIAVRGTHYELDSVPV